MGRSTLKKRYLAVVGSREGVLAKAVTDFIDRFDPLTTVLVSGGARGVDTIAAEHARSRGMEVIEILPEWEKHGKYAGLKRNGDIVRKADDVAAFWNGTSRGTLDTVRKAGKMNRNVALFDGKGQLMQFAPTLPPRERMDVPQKDPALNTRNARKA